MRGRGFTLIELMIVIAIIAIIAAIAIPGLQRARMVANERNASASLKSVVTSEENFKSNDLDRNGIGDYWTGDLAGLYCLQQLGTGNAISAVGDIGMASADINSNNASVNGYATLQVAYNATLLLAASPKSGYAYQALLNNPLGLPYAADTDSSGSLVHSFNGFGFMSVPFQWDSLGNYIMVVNESATVYRRDFSLATAQPVFGTQMLTFDGATPCDFPTAAVISASWNKVD